LTNISHVEYQNKTNSEAGIRRTIQVVGSILFLGLKKRYRAAQIKFISLGREQKGANTWEIL
jgi:hypothetical protein